MSEQNAEIGAHETGFLAGYEQAREDFAALIEEYAELRGRTAFQPWFNPIAGARAQGRVAGLDKAAEIVRGQVARPGEAASS